MVDEEDLAFAVRHIWNVARAHEQAEAIAQEIRPGVFKVTGSRPEREKQAAALIKSLKLKRESGGLSLPRFVALAGFFALRVHEERITDGDYAAEIDPIIERISEVEREHGLSPVEFWLKGQGPPEWQRLNEHFDAGLRQSLRPLLG